jgi:predicted NUDIX family NTP pyrophosphohydrolase
MPKVYFANAWMPRYSILSGPVVEFQPQEPELDGIRGSVWEDLPVPAISAGLLMYRRSQGRVQVFLAHPGGPYFRNKDDGAWTIPKGEPNSGEDLLLTAQREFEEETGWKPVPPFISLHPIRQKGGKLVHAWAFEGDYDVSCLRSNTFSIHWPPRSGKQQEFPEIDRADYFDLSAARQKIRAEQAALIDELEACLAQ